MKRCTLIEHKKVVIVCEENGPINFSYNVLLTTLEDNIIVKLVAPIVPTKLALTYTNCAKTCHSLKTCHNKKKRVLIVPTAIIKSTNFIVETRTQCRNPSFGLATKAKGVTRV